MNDGKEQISQREAGRRLGLTAQSLGQWRKRPGAPAGLKAGKPVYLWPDFPRWREAELVRQAKLEAAPVDFEEARARKMAAEASLAELELARERGQLIPIELHGSRLARILERIRSRLVALPGSLAPRLVGLDAASEAQGIISGSVAAVLKELSQ